MQVKWTMMFPYTAMVPARRGGEWRLTVESRNQGQSWQWNVVHSADTGFARSGAAHSVNFAKAQAEQAVVELDAADGGSTNRLGHGDR